MKEKEGELVRLLVEHSDETAALKGKISSLEDRLEEVRRRSGSNITDIITDIIDDVNNDVIDDVIDDANNDVNLIIRRSV